MSDPQSPLRKSLLDHVIWFCLTNKLVVVLLTLFVVGAGIFVAPFDWDTGSIERKPVPVDAIPDIGENQQIVFTEWMGRSPQDVEDQITYPLTTALLGLPSVQTVRSFSMFGFSTIYIIFKEEAEFYWTRSRILEKLNSLPAGTLPEGVQPTLGPDATAIGQVFWYTLEGRDEQGRVTGDGTFKNCEPSRIGTCVMPCSPRLASPKWLLWAGTSRNIKSTSTLMRCGHTM